MRDISQEHEERIAAMMRDHKERPPACCRSDPCKHPGVGPCDMPAHGGLGQILNQGVEDYRSKHELPHADNVTIVAPGGPYTLADYGRGYTIPPFEQAMPIAQEILSELCAWFDRHWIRIDCIASYVEPKDPQAQTGDYDLDPLERLAEPYRCLKNLPLIHKVVPITWCRRAGVPTALVEDYPHINWVATAAQMLCEVARREWEVALAPHLHPLQVAKLSGPIDRLYWRRRPLLETAAPEFDHLDDVCVVKLRFRAQIEFPPLAAFDDEAGGRVLDRWWANLRVGQPLPAALSDRVPHDRRESYTIPAPKLLL